MPKFKTKTQPEAKGKVIKKRKRTNKVPFPHTYGGQFAMRPKEFSRLMMYYPEITFAAYRVFDVLCGYYNRIHKCSYPGNRTLMKEAAIIDPHTLFSAIKQLIALGLVERGELHRRKTGKVQKVYFLPKYRELLEQLDEFLKNKGDDPKDAGAETFVNKDEDDEDEEDEEEEGDEYKNMGFRR